MEIDGIPVEEKDVPCRFDHGTPREVAVALYDMPDGCFCYPEDRKQALCISHIQSASPRGGMTPIVIYHPALYNQMKIWQNRRVH
jgi:hypothetical protein